MEKPTMIRSIIANCLVATREGDNTLFEDTAHGDGSFYVNLEGYLICPAELVTEEQMKILFPGESDISKLMTFAAAKSRGGAAKNSLTGG